MLAPDDRAVLRQHLRPELGDTLDTAVATAFTLDLAAALVMPRRSQPSMSPVQVTPSLFSKQSGQPPTRWTCSAKPATEVAVPTTSKLAAW